jgi:hypothetical protein
MLDELSILIDDARSGRLSRREVFLRGQQLDLTPAAILALVRSVSDSHAPGNQATLLWRFESAARVHLLPQRVGYDNRGRFEPCQSRVSA